MTMSRRTALAGVLTAPALIPQMPAGTFELPIDKVNRLTRELAEAIRDGGNDIYFKRVTVSPDYALHTDYRGRSVDWQIRHLASEIRNEAMRLDPRITNVWCGYDQNADGTKSIRDMIFERV